MINEVVWATNKRKTGKTIFLDVSYKLQISIGSINADTWIVHPIVRFAKRHKGYILLRKVVDSPIVLMYTIKYETIDFTAVYPPMIKITLAVISRWRREANKKRS